MNNTNPKALDFFNKAAPILDSLKGRWEDECQYEDFKDYIIPFQPIARECGAKLVKMNQRPFEVQYRVNGQNFFMRVKGNQIVLIEEEPTLKLDKFV